MLLRNNKIFLMFYIYIHIYSNFIQRDSSTYTFSLRSVYELSIDLIIRETDSQLQIQCFTVRGTEGAGNSLSHRRILSGKNSVFMDGWRFSSKKLVCSGTSLVHFTFLSLSSSLGIGSPFITKLDHMLVEISTIGISGASLSKYGKTFFMKKRYCKSSWCDTPEKDMNKV